MEKNHSISKIIANWRNIPVWEYLRLLYYFNQNDVLWGLYIEVMCQLKNWQVTPVTYRSFVSAWWFVYEMRIWPFFFFTRKNLKWLMKKLVVWGDFIHQDWLLGSLFHWVQMHFVISKSLRNGLIPFLITLCTFFSTVFWKLFKHSHVEVK